MTPTSDTPKADIRLFKIVHETFRRVLGAISDAAGALDPHDTAQAERLRDRWAFYERTLTHHHEDEDQEMFPALVRHLPSFHTMRGELHADHEVVAAEMLAVDDAFRRLPEQCDAAAVAELHRRLEALRNTLVPHLDREDAEVLPMIAEHMPPAEWDQLSEDALKTIPKRDLPLAVGALDATIQTVPPSEQPPPPPLPLRLMLAVSWRRKFRRYLEALEVSPS